LIGIKISDPERHNYLIIIIIIIMQFLMRHVSVILNDEIAGMWVM